MINKGLTVGEQVPVVDVADLAGEALKVGAPRTDGLSTLLLFVSPTCPVCESLLPVLRASRKQEKSWLQIVLASDGDLATQREFVRDHDLGDFQYVVSAPLGMTYQVSRLPFAALVDGKGVLRARGLVNSREHLESLFEAQRLGVASLQEYFVAHG
jgi:methylamine dehydrogenase accessory protein MauD